MYPLLCHSLTVSNTAAAAVTDVAFHKIGFILKQQIGQIMNIPYQLNERFSGKSSFITCHLSEVIRISLK